MEILTFLFSLVAGMTGIILWRLEWLKAPQHAWRVRRHITPPTSATATDAPRPGRADVHVLSEGRATVYSVVCTLLGESVAGRRPRVHKNRFSPESDPLHLSAPLPHPDPRDLWVEITWVTFRPNLHHGERINVHTGEFLRWRWSWTSLRLGRRPGEGWSGARVYRAKGRWIHHSARPMALIPEDR
ncbi:hypothetical protein [Nocardiopsis lambiniae]|uniref:DUF2550 family protein n=1 Tax=Nocardiopsis lambiniae TaxID=3075539 RepID=A0ABU2MBC5_9ACTN|nr:hypothetical protein [Nocardiopsis sp. DSM 44743]MDT0329978.1 hypothetical protein [Nocardiopsis sp. DSM 44743]